jgi:ABC-type maltose transport system permease subunit
MTLARRIAGEGSFYTAVIVLVTFAAFPFYWMLITTFKTDGDLYNLKFNPYWFNAAPTLEHLRYLFEETLFAQWLWNTALIGVCVVAITIAIFLRPHQTNFSRFKRTFHWFRLLAQHGEGGGSTDERADAAADGHCCKS